ncbi:MAG: hypothetical protein ABL890_00715 [Candidatus Peribacteraceae bacterium]
MEQNSSFRIDTGETPEKKLEKIIKRTGKPVAFHCSETKQVVTGIISGSMTGAHARVRTGTLEDPRIVTKHHDELIFDYEQNQTPQRADDSLQS